MGTPTNRFLLSTDPTGPRCPPAGPWDLSTRIICLWGRLLGTPQTDPSCGQIPQDCSIFQKHQTKQKYLKIQNSLPSPLAPRRPVWSAHKKNLFVGSVIGDPHNGILTSRFFLWTDATGQLNSFLWGLPSNRPHKQILLVGRSHGPARGPRRRGGYFEFLDFFFILFLSF